MKTRRQVFAILRYDDYQEASVPIANRISVTRIVDDEVTARAEVKRLTELNADKGCQYFWQATRYFESQEHN